MLPKLLNTRIVCFLFSLMLSLGSAQGQTGGQYEKAGDQAMIDKDYYAALVYYQEAHTIKNDEQILFKLARAAYNLKDFSTAEGIVQDLIKGQSGSRIEQLEYLQGLIYFAQGKYQSAKRCFQFFLSKSWYGKSKRALADAETKINWCKSAMFYSKAVAYDSNSFDFKLQEGVNSSFLEFAPLLKGDSIWFSSSRNNKIYCYDGKNGKFKSYAPSGLAASEEIAFFQPLSNDKALCCLCKSINQVDRNCQLQFWDLKRNRLSAVQGALGSELFTVSQPFVDLEKRILYFSSNGFDASGNRDIFKIPLDSLELVVPVKVKGVNSRWNEESPYVKGDTLFFSSNRPVGLGGYDLYYKVLDKRGFSLNMGTSVNSPYDEKYLALDDSRMLICSNRPLLKGKDKRRKDFACSNIYVKARQNKENIKKQEEEKLSGNTDPISQRTNHLDVLSSALFFPNNHPLQGASLQSTYKDNYTFYLKESAFYLKKTDEPSLFKEFIERDLIAGMLKLDRHVEQVLRNLEKGLKYTIEINSYASPRAEPNYNMALSLRRTEAVKRYLLKIKEGRLAYFVERGQLVFLTENFGETTSPTNVSSDLLNKEKSVYSVGASKERRVEVRFVPIEMDEE